MKIADQGCSFVSGAKGNKLKVEHLLRVEAKKSLKKEQGRLILT